MFNVKINEIKSENESKHDAFENLTKYLIMRELGVDNIDSFHNQPGIESEPFILENGKRIGFQSKFFNYKFNWNELEKSLLKNKNGNVFEYYKLDELYIYSNFTKTPGRQKNNLTKQQERIEKKASEYNCTIYYLCGGDLEVKINQPKNLDLAQLYFGTGDELGFIKNSLDKKKKTFIDSKKYFELVLTDNKNIKFNYEEILKDKKIVLIKGRPGTGKTIFMHSLLIKYGGLEKSTQKEMIDILVKNNAVPILINLKNCFNESLENIIRGRKNDSKVDSRNLDFIYILDGLDELDSERADLVISQIEELGKKNNTKKIIISSRSGNSNILVLRSVFDEEIDEYEINDLTWKNIKSYFDKIENQEKIEKVKEFKDGHFTTEIKDTLLLSLFWDVILKLDNDNSIFNLFDLKMDYLFNPKHKKNLESINLLDSKRNEIVEINKDLSFEFQKQFQFTFSKKEVQDLIINKYSRLDYNDVNNIFNYNSDLFFTGGNDSYIYSHRRWQEYFSVQKLKEEFEKDPNILRKYNFMLNKEYFQNLFLKYLKREYKKNNDFSSIVFLNSLIFYLNGSDKGYGAPNEPIYDYSMYWVDFVSTLFQQNNNIFNELWNDDNLEIKKKLLNQINSIYNISSEERNKKIKLKTKLSLILGNIIHKTGKKENIEKYYSDFEKLIKSNKDEDKESVNEFIEKNFQEYLYYKLIYKDDGYDKFFKIFRENYGLWENNNWVIKRDLSRKEYFIKSFFNFSWNHKRADLLNSTKEFDDTEKITFLSILSNTENMREFFDNDKIQKKVKDIVNSLKISEINGKNYHILFYKRIFDIEFNKKEIKFIEEKILEISQERMMDLVNPYHVEDKIKIYELLSYVDISNEKNNEGNTKYFHHNSLFITKTLYIDYIDRLSGSKINFKKIISKYLKTSLNQLDNHLNNEIGYLLSLIINESNLSTDELTTIKNIIFYNKPKIKFSFLNNLLRIDKDKYKKIVSENDIVFLEDELKEKKEFDEYSKSCLELSLLYSVLNPKKAKKYFIKSISHGLIRHGWRKDSFVAFGLTGSFEVLLKNNWLSEEEIERYSFEILNLTERSLELSDGRTTEYGIGELLRIISKFNLGITEKIYEEIKKRGYKKREYIKIISIAKIKNARPLYEIESHIEDMLIFRQYDGKIYSEFYINKIEIYFEIMRSEFYSEKEKKESFDKIYSLIQNLDLEDYEFKEYLKNDLWKEYDTLCKKYNKENKVKKPKKENIYVSSRKIITEEEILKDIEKLKNKRDLNSIYKKFKNRDLDIEIKNSDTLIQLIKKTKEISGSVKLFLDFLDNNKYPSTYSDGRIDIYNTSISFMLSELDMRDESKEYLENLAEHDALESIINVYAGLGDKKMVLKLFEKYLKISDFITYNENNKKLN